MFELNGKVAVVTGASRGIGRAVALALAGQGAAVVANYAHNSSAANDVVDGIRAGGGEAIAVQADVCIPSEAKALIESAIERFAHVDILVNNAGITRDNLLIRMSEEEWDAVLNTNLKGAFNTIKAVARPMMRQRAGRIINIASVAGLSGNAGQANYSAAKAGLIGLTKTAARELASRNITANAIAPGFVETDLTAPLPEDLKAKALDYTLLHRMGRPEEIAAAVVFLASEEAGFITGQVLIVDGGIAL